MKNMTSENITKNVHREIKEVLDKYGVTIELYVNQHECGCDLSATMENEYGEKLCSYNTFGATLTISDMESEVV